MMRHPLTMKVWRRLYLFQTTRKMASLVMAFSLLNTAASAQCHVAVQAIHTEISCLESEAQIIWTDMSNTAFDGTLLNKTSGGNDWNAGAASVTSIGYGGSIYLIVKSTEGERNFGLSSLNTGADQNSIRHSFHLRDNGGLRIRELSFNRGDFGNYSVGDTLRIEHQEEGTRYYRNSELLYISQLAGLPTLITDVSLKSESASLGPITLINPTDGQFLLHTDGDGMGATYEWFLNSVSTGTFGSNLDLLTPQDGDTITCLITPGTGSCFSGDTLTTTYILGNRRNPDPFEFYITSISSDEGCVEFREEVIWDQSQLFNVQLESRILKKFDGGDDWNGGAFSLNTINDNGYFEFLATENNLRRMVGISDSNINSHWNTIDFAFYLENNGNLSIRENGANYGNVGSYNTGDTLKISIENGIVHYYRNGNILRVGGAAGALMHVDLSIRDEQGSIENAHIVNLGEGIITALAANAGLTPTYQWRKNGLAVGTNSIAYNGPAIEDGDILSCEITPDANTCTSIIYSSNQIVAHSVEEPSFEAAIPFASNISTITGYAYAEEDVIWKVASLQNLEVNEGDLLKFQSANNWNGGAASLNRVYDNGYLEFSSNENDMAKMVGLSTDDTNSDFNTIGFAFYLVSNGAVRIYESGVNRGNYGTYAAGDVFRIGYQNGAIEYYRNGVLLRTATGGAASYLVDVSIRDIGGTLVGAIAGNLCDGDFTVNADGAGTSPLYQWQLNGSNASAGSASYSNPNLVDGDILTCLVSPDFSGCSSESYTSNQIRIIGPTSVTNWTGAVNNNWSLEGNWTFGAPNEFISAIIPAEPINQPILTVASAVNDVEIQVGANLSLSNQSLLVNGDFTTDGSLNAQTGTVVFTGLGEANISGNETTFHRFVINKTNEGEGVTLSTPIRIQDETVFIRGNIRAIDNEIIYENDADSRTGLDISHVEGFIRKIGNDEFTFPVGIDGTYAPIGISSPSSTTDEFVASYHNTDPSDSGFDTSSRDLSLATLSGCEHWILDREVGTSAVFVTLGYEYVRSCQTPEPSDLRISRWDGSSWQNHGYGGHVGDSLWGSVTSGEPISNFSPFTFGSGSFNNPLPIKLLTFDAKVRSDMVIVDWTTATEINNDFFTVERSADGLVFEPIGIVRGSGNSNMSLSYSFFDEKPIPGVSYYRLRQTDFDGQFEIFPSVPVEFTSPVGLFVYPNPAKDRVLIQTEDQNRKQIRLLNLSGQALKSFISEDSVIEIDLSSIRKGVYTIEVTNFSQTEYRKLMVE
ncbi:MAG: T9SS type A sorting domain-containing protein [Flavobacteriales bacterium]|nr:T9SS type A sorting domain-containing protein [Flavobacteriales bacterium]